MAEDNAVAGPPRKGKLKTILLLVIILVLAVGLSVAGTFWFLSKGSSGVAEDESATAEEDAFLPAEYMVMDRPLVTTIRDPGRQRYIQVYLAFESTEAPALAAAQKHLPLLRNALIAELGQLDFMELQTPEGRQGLPDRLLVAVNETLAAEGEPVLDRVLLRNFVVQ
ncbi:flagellar basal body-associated protein FliL [Marinobacter sp.]